MTSFPSFAPCCSGIDESVKGNNRLLREHPYVTFANILYPSDLLHCYKPADYSPLAYILDMPALFRFRHHKCLPPGEEEGKPQIGERERVRVGWPQISRARLTDLLARPSLTNGRTTHHQRSKDRETGKPGRIVCAVLCRKVG